ncbi:GIY-YIG nuclease family protein [Lutibacter sp. A80]|uniref:NUMOD1 domain-containing DNA-binding protein n=1 Tax=Lutibacter sp. A80 TaxID=2918453 RepID=UPI001F051BDC|nr:NUMOD1 domain-containing DNA-binding protein [Lutibacter sp. A80]UMB59911.1 GIY-YIG nuclease family protein [Lutibacter sp. A80]
MKNKKGIVYTITNKNTKETYVGITTVSLKSRRNDHIERAKRGEKGKLFTSILTYNIEAFEFNEIDSTYSLDELAAKEKQYIKQYKEKGISLNADSGGGIKKSVHKYDIDGQLVATYETLTEAANSVGTTKQQISSTCLNVNNLYAGYYWSYTFKVPFIPGVDKRLKQVLQLDLEGNLLRSFKSVADASRETGVYKGCIAKVCRFERKQAGGYKWRYF